ncbi:MAG: DMT family transporter [Elusimicrobia bacterium]|nr:DMT family transporter [Elusimicrobiota bacterium]MDE2425063.1 DMT family transporter [Elusimicrobiota bacterium]
MSLVELGLFYCAAIWGATFYLIKDSLSAVSPEALVGYRFLLSAALLLPWVARRRRRTRHLGQAALLALLLSTLYVSQTVGLEYTSASNSGFITGLFVVFVPLFLLLFLGKPPTKTQWAASALAAAGLWILTGGIKHANRGDGLTLIAAMTYAGHLLATDRCVKADADLVLLAFHQFWLTGLLSLAFGAVRGASFAVRGTGAYWIVLFLAVFPTLSAFFIQMVAQKRSAPLRVALIFSLEPVFAAAFAWTLGGEPFVPARAAGGALIVLAMIAGELSKLELTRGRRKEVLPA